ncbi:MAG: polysaccharide deacetylase family protein, partial [Pirellulaceae bacterium]
MNAGDLAKRTAGYFAVGLHGLLRSWVQEDLSILLYHRVTDVKPGVPPPGFSVTPDQFYEQLHGLQKRGFTFLALTRAIQLAETGKPWPRKPLVVTLDDGFENVYLHAWPLLRRLGIPATIFVNTAFLNSNEPFPFDSWGHQYGNDVPAETY